MHVQEAVIDESFEAAGAAPVRYRSFSATAITSLVFSVLSILTIFGWVFWAIPILSIYLAVRALKQIRYASEEYTGEAFARAGIAVAVVLWLTGMYMHHYIQQHSVPSGYKPISFDYLQPNADQAGELIPPAAFELEPTDTNPDKRVFIKEGYIYPGRRSVNIKEFILVPTLGHCQFCTPQLRSTDMINVKLSGDLSVDYTFRPIKVGGKLHIDRAGRKSLGRPALSARRRLRAGIAGGGRWAVLAGRLLKSSYGRWTVQNRKRFFPVIQHSSCKIHHFKFNLHHLSLVFFISLSRIKAFRYNQWRMSDYIIRYGVMRFLGVFSAPAGQSFRRGLKVITRTERGLEAGEILSEATPEVLGRLSDPPTGQILRMMTQKTPMNWPASKSTPLKNWPSASDTSTNWN